MGKRSEIRKKGHRHELMLAWRFALLTYLDAAIKADALNSEAERAMSWRMFSKLKPNAIGISSLVAGYPKKA